MLMVICVIGIFCIGVMEEGENFVWWFEWCY